MKATGIVRRIDDLGRIVIPKEIRRNLHIRESDPMEIYTDSQGQVILKKYSSMEAMYEFTKSYADSLSRSSGHGVIITDREKIIASSGLGKSFTGKALSRELISSMDSRKFILAKRENRDFKDLLGETEKEYSSLALAPVIAAGDIVGSIIILEENPKNKLTENDMLLAKFAADFLGNI